MRTDCALHTQKAFSARRFTTLHRKGLLQRSNFIKLGLINARRRSAL